MSAEHLLNAGPSAGCFYFGVLRNSLRRPRKHTPLCINVRKSTLEDVGKQGPCDSRICALSGSFHHLSEKWASGP